MLSESETIARRASELACEACVELFNAYGVQLKSAGELVPNDDERLLCSVVGFVSRRLKGTCLLAATESPLVESCPDGGRLRDWVGELANQLTGRLKTKFLARGVEVALTTPIVLSGVSIQPLPRNELKPVILLANSGEVRVWVEVEAVEGFDFKSPIPGDATHAGEGDILLF